MRESQSQSKKDEGKLQRAPLDRFAAINRDRLRRMREGLPTRQALCLDVLPLLFHSNHPLLPGYLSATAPSGIHDYQPSTQAIAAAQKLARTFTPAQKLARQHDLLGIYLMGSCGTIAHSESSDYDVWLCHGAHLTEQQCDELKQKASAIESWAYTLNVEMHFFIFDPAQFKGGVNEQLSTESSGSTQHYLLLDEFYRSGIVVAGLYPIWFEVPAEEETNYDTYVKNLVHDASAPRHVYVDFGGVGHVPTEEYFGATLWQLYKSINSPFKSVLKLLLMEVYAQSYPTTDMLSVHFKRDVYAGVTNLLELDPYLRMCRMIEDYLSRQDDRTRIDVLRRCLYLKIDEPLSRTGKQKQDNWRRLALKALVAEWQWSAQKIALLDNKEGWQIDTVLQERRDLVSTITQSYKMLSRFARKHVALSRISEADLIVLGRKLYVAFERKAGKLELVNRGIADSLWASEVTLRQEGDAAAPTYWSLLLGRGTPDIDRGNSTKQASSVIELICWAYFNRILDKRSHVKLQISSVALSLREVSGILGQLEKQYPEAAPHAATMQDLTNSPHLRTGLLFVNVGIDPLKAHSTDGRHLASARSNALSYGGKHHNLAITFDLLIETSWGELFTYRYAGINGLLDCLRDYLQWAPPSRRKAPPPLSISCFSSSYDGVISLSLARVFKSLLIAFYGTRPNDRARYVLDIEDRHYIITSQNDEISHIECHNYSALLRQLATSSKEFSRTVIDEQSLSHTLLPLIYSENKPGQINMFLQTLEKHVEIYVLDEEGALYTQVLPYYDVRLLLQQFMLFFAAINRRRYVYLANNESPFRDPSVQIYSIVKSDKQTRALKQIIYAFDAIPRQYFNIQVIIQPAENGQRNFTIYCNDKEFSTLQLGNGVFQAVARHILTLRARGRAYPIYITDIDVAPDLIAQASENPLQTIHYLNYKKNIEDRLNDALTQTASQR